MPSPTLATQENDVLSLFNCNFDLENVIDLIAVSDPLCDHLPMSDEGNLHVVFFSVQKENGFAALLSFDTWQQFCVYV